MIAGLLTPAAKGTPVGIMWVLDENLLDRRQQGVDGR